MNYYEPIQINGGVLWRRRSTEDEITLLELPPDLYRDLRDLAEARGMSTEAFIEYALEVAILVRGHGLTEPPKY